MKTEEIKNILTRLFNEKDALKNVDGDADIFDLGVSSLTVVELQIKAEEALQLETTTSDLMRHSTLNGWIKLYSNLSQQTAV
ncbi:hypothetical protein A5320_18125 [Rheinheimera sp. SA_1]|uniref:acyl carrier protein n=1 Tax=Rheinheimera sp. SA_1 TaxID=1827365 RepID=UPI0007FB9E96|nr:acyl carrier protein [Rheinheimera sp. SA_1]OBP13525.1 hypothetical protein A5320_18125 [Rheinheimera sp. SA_1]